MKDFTRGPGRLALLPLPARVTYTIFLLFTWAGLAVTAWLAEEMVGLDLAEVGQTYAGERRGEDDLAPPTGPGPELELPEDALRPPPPEPMPLRKLLEVTHFHLFSMPIYLMVLAHLFLLSRMRPAGKLTWVVIATAGTIVHLIAPWVARSGGTFSVWLYGLSGLALLLAYAVMSVVPIWEMWTPPPRARPDTPT